MTSAFLLVNVEFPFEDDVMAKLRDIPEIVDVYRVQGMYDIIAKIELDNEEKLKELVSERIRKIERITGTVTIMIAQGKVWDTLDLKKLVNYSLSQNFINARNCILIMALYGIYGSHKTESSPLSNNRTRNIVLKMAQDLGNIANKNK